MSLRSSLREARPSAPTTTLPPATPCSKCQSSLFWKSISSSVHCANCEPPSTPSLRVAWLHMSESSPGTFEWEDQPEPINNHRYEPYPTKFSRKILQRISKPKSDEDLCAAYIELQMLRDLPWLSPSRVAAGARGRGDAAGSGLVTGKSGASQEISPREGDKIAPCGRCQSQDVVGTEVEDGKWIRFDCRSCGRTITILDA